MTLKEKINKDYMEAFKSKNAIAKSLLSVIKGDIQTVEKNINSDSLSDEDVMKILLKTSKSLKETISLSNDSNSKLELEILESYLPKQMSREDILSKINELISSGISNIGGIMKEFSSLPADKKLVSEVAKEVIK